MKKAIVILLILFAGTAGFWFFKNQKAGPDRIYPNPKLTPGATLTVDKDKVCTPGYAQSVRDVPIELKKMVYQEYKLDYPQKPGVYEVDHFIPLELGGSNDIKNLWPEPAEPRPGYHEKDRYENFAHQGVCGGEISLQEAQRRVSVDWYRYWLKAGRQ